MFPQFFVVLDEVLFLDQMGYHPSCVVERNDYARYLEDGTIETTPLREEIQHRVNTLRVFSSGIGEKEVHAEDVFKIFRYRIPITVGDIFGLLDGNTIPYRLLNEFQEFEFRWLFKHLTDTTNVTKHSDDVVLQKVIIVSVFVVIQLELRMECILSDDWGRKLC